MPDRRDAEKMNLPARIFLYTPDQIGAMFELKEEYVRKTLLFYDRREAGIAPRGRLRAYNIAPEGETPEWRVTENEVIRYLRHKGVKFYDRGYVL